MKTTISTTTVYFEENASLNHLKNAIIASGLTHSASELKEACGYSNLIELNEAVQRAMNAMKSLRISTSQHFQAIYCSQDGLLSIDWRLSPLAYYLVTINGDPSNPLVAKTQLELLSKQLMNSK